jgi:HSP20 family protein
VSVNAHEDDYVIRAYVPGVKAEDLNIEVIDNAVTLAGEFPVLGVEGERSLLDELPTGSFYRRMLLGTDLDAENSSAEVHDGILTLRVPKAESAKARKITVAAT